MTFVEAATLSALTEGRSLAVEVDGVEVALVRVGDEVFAIRDECSHASFPLSDGDVEGYSIECSLHGSCFDLRTGKPLNFPATQPVPIYPTRVEGETVLVDLSTPN